MDSWKQNENARVGENVLLCLAWDENGNLTTRIGVVGAWINVSRFQRSKKKNALKETSFKKIKFSIVDISTAYLLMKNDIKNQSGLIQGKRL